MRILTYLLPALLLLAVWASRVEAQGRDEAVLKYDLREVYERVAEERDEVSSYWPYVLALRGDEDGFATFRKAMRLLKKPRLIEGSYSWVAAHQELPSRDLALEFLEEEVLKAPRIALRVGAARGCTRFRDVQPLLERLLRQSKDDEVRAVVLVPLTNVLARRGDVESLQLILENAEPSDGSQIATLERALARFTSAKSLELLKQELVHHQTSDDWRLLLMERLRAEPGSDVTEAMLDFLRRRDPRIQLLALEILEARGWAERIRKDLLGMIDSRDDALCFAAIVIAGRTLAGDPRWSTKLEQLAEHRDPVRRMAATSALADLRNPEALERLYSMLADEDWRVRVAVMRAMASLRRKDSIPLLIAALEGETGRVQWELIRTLEHLSGMSLGRSPALWQRWWDAEGATFTVPTADEVKARAAAQAERASEQRTVATFYGIPVLSERVCFVLDTSGSMSEPAVVEGRTQTADEEAGPTRLDVAKEQLRNMLAALTPERRCNMVFFSTDVHAWQDEVVKLDERARKDALRFVGAQRASGGTNLFDALAMAFADQLIDTVYVLSDGQPNAGSVVGTEAIRRAVKRINSFREIQIHCIAIGADSRLMKLLAEDSGGEYRNVGRPPEPEEKEQ